MLRPGSSLGALLCALSFALAGCENEGNAATALVVSVRSDLPDLVEVELAVFEASADPSQDTPEDDQITKVPATLSDLPISLVVAKGKASEVMLAVRGLDRRGNRLVETRTRARFAAGQSLAVHVFLGEVCRDKPCEEVPKQTCYLESFGSVNAGECGTIRVLRAADLSAVMSAGQEHEWDAPEVVVEGPFDASVDAGAQMDARTPEVDSGLGTPVDTGTIANDAGTVLPADAAARDGGAADGALSDARVPEAGAPDAGCNKPPLTNAQCGLAPQCGCPAGHACRVAGTQITACTPAGAAAPISACTTAAECPAGHDCIGQRCAPLCNTDGDCAGTGSLCIDISWDSQLVSGARACMNACNRTTNAPCGAGTTCARLTNALINGRNVNGNFCLNPRVYAQCPFTGDGRCDEPEDGRACPEGTDVADCAPACVPPTPAGGTCDLVRQCGCATGQACGEIYSGTGTAITVGCRAPGTVVSGGRCTASTQCTTGHTCIGGLCARHCRVDADCASAGPLGGRCGDVLSNTGVAIPGWRYCAVNCNSTTQQPCVTGSICPPLTGPYCWVPRTPCPADLLGNGRCDEPEGSQLCAEGTDTAECP